MTNNKTKIDRLFSDLLKQYYNSIYKYCFYNLSYERELSEECTQDIFLALYESLGAMAENTNINAWLYRTAYNYIRRYISRAAFQKKKVASLENDKVEDFYDNYEYEIENSLDRRIDEYKYVRSILGLLTAEERELYTLCFQEKKSIDEIAAALQISSPTATTRIYRLKLKIKRIAHDQIKSELVI